MTISKQNEKKRRTPSKVIRRFFHSQPPQRDKPHKYYTLCGTSPQDAVSQKERIRCNAIDILYSLYSGDLYPAEKINPTDPAYRKITSQIEEELEQLKSRLSSPDRERLEHLHDLLLDASCREEFANFASGFKLGLLLMHELLAA